MREWVDCSDYWAKARAFAPQATAPVHAGPLGAALAVGALYRFDCIFVIIHRMKAVLDNFAHVQVSSPFPLVIPYSRLLIDTATPAWPALITSAPKVLVVADEALNEAQNGGGTGVFEACGAATLCRYIEIGI